jgi:hypothetical protein
MSETTPANARLKKIVREGGVVVVVLGHPDNGEPLKEAPPYDPPHAGRPFPGARLTAERPVAAPAGGPVRRLSCPVSASGRPQRSRG